MSTDTLHPNELLRQESGGSDVFRQILVITALAATLVVNGLANALPLNNLTTGDISDRFEVYFVPASYVFSIWGVIYLALIGYAIYQALPAQRRDPDLHAIGGWFVLSSVANSVWIFLWHYEYFTLTLIAMVVLLGSLIVIYQRLAAGVNRAQSAKRWLVQLPFSIYLGWVSVATIANATTLLDYLGWSGWGVSPVVWGVTLLVVGALVGLAFGLLRGDIAFVAVIVWAFVGIAVKQSATPAIAWTAAILAGVVGLSLLAGLLRRRAIGLQARAT